MPDAFFATNKNRKRKRSASAEQGPSSSKKPALPSKPQGGKGKKAAAATATPTAKPTSKKAVKDDHIDALSDLISGYARPEDNIPVPSAAPKKKK